MIKEEFEKFLKEWSPKISLNCGEPALELFLRRIDVIKSVIEAEISKLKKDNSSLKDEIEILRSLVGKQDMVEIESKMLSLVSESAALRDKIEYLKSELEKKEQQLLDSHTTIETLKRDTSVLEDIHKKELARLEEVISSVNKSLESLNNDWTNKYTALSKELEREKQIYQNRLDKEIQNIWSFSYEVMNGFISHIRGMMGPVFGATDYLSAAVTSSPLTHPFSILKLKKQIAPDVKLIKDYTTGLVQVLNQISDFFKVTPQREVVDINEIFRDLKGKYARILMGLSVNWPEEKEYPKVILDKSLFTEAITLIIDNALESLGGGKQDEVRSGSILIKMTSDDMFLYIEISNSGPPIPEENLDKLFTPFFTTKPQPHQGLGLVKAKRNILFHEGAEISYQLPSPDATESTRSGIFKIKIKHQ